MMDKNCCSAANTDQSPARSCVDCMAKSCDEEGRAFPAFCVTTHLDPAVLEEAMKEYHEDPETNRIACMAAEVEAEYYCKMTRLEETMEFARKMGYKKIGIACCVGLLREAGIVAKVFRHNGFEVYATACKAGAQPKESIGVDPKCNAMGVNMCNPVLQAKNLAAAGTELNLLIGLCVGHDSLFYKYSEAPVTTLVVKDRVLGHNPAAAIYQAESYYRRKLFPDGELVKV